MIHAEMIRNAELLMYDADDMLDRITELEPDRIPTARFVRDETARLYVEIVTSSPNRQDWTPVAARLIRAMTMAEALRSPLQ
jgi:hypothetical protein